MKLSVIIPCYNAGATIAEQLEAFVVQQWSESWEIIISNNGSTDTTLDIVEQYRERLPNMRIVDSSEKKGAAYAMNVGAKAAKGDALAICDADDVVAPGWVAAIGEALEQYEMVASRFDYEKLNGDWSQRNHKWLSQQKGLPKTRFHPHLLFAGCCGLGMRRELHEALGGFDESIPVLFDPDYCFRAQLRGAKIEFVPEALVHIRNRTKLSRAFSQARVWGRYNVLLYKRYRTPESSFPIHGEFIFTTGCN